MTAEDPAASVTALSTPTPEVRRPARRDIRPALLLGLVPMAGAIILIRTPAEARPVVFPLLALLSIATLYVAVVIRRERRVPVFEIGSMFVVVVTIYGSVPLLNYIAGGLAWNESSDSRLLRYSSLPPETGAFAWNYVALLASFVVLYLLVRGRAEAISMSIRRPHPNLVMAILVVTVGLIIYFLVMARLFGLSYARGYVNAGGTVEVSLPLIVLQVSHNLYGILGVEKQLLLIVLISGWRSMRNRFLVLLLLGYEAFVVLNRFGARTDLALLVLTAVVLYHRLVRPFSLKLAVTMMSIGLFAIIAYGVVRDAKVSGLRRAAMASSSNEFQALFGTAFDLHKRRELGLLDDVPWQIYASDFYLFIPSQILPFEKINPSQWYLSVLGIDSSGYMFGILAQAAVGKGWPEVLARGALLGVIFALIHRWYIKHHGSFWATGGYVFLIAWTYYAFRATTLYWVYFVVYRFIPAMFVTWFIAWLVGTRWRGRVKRPARG